jgi:hypothetical protein
MVIKITTQVVENYDIDGHSPPFSYWKFKGGDEYYVLGTDERPANAAAKIHMVLQERKDLNPLWIEYITGWEPVWKIPEEARDADKVYTLDSPVNPRQRIEQSILDAGGNPDAVDDLLTKTYGKA